MATVPRARPGVLRHEVSVGQNYGNLPAAELMRKYEETNMGPDEELVDDYVRLQIMDRTPDATKFEHEAPRGAVNRRAGVLEHHYYGHRGCADWEKPEIFLGFAGPEHHDPRGVRVDPDMKQMKSQAEKRNRFIRFTADDSNHVTGGGRSEGQLMKDQQSLFRISRNRLKVFSRQLDGRREGMRRDTPRQVSNVKKQINTESYADLIRDYGLTPQRRANVTCQRMVRDSKAWREGTADQDFQIAKYMQIARRSNKKETYRRVLGAKNNDDTVWTDADSSVPFKTMGLLMADIVKTKRKAHGIAAQSDRDFEEQKKTQDRKAATFKRDLELVMYMTTMDADAAEGDETAARKTPEMRRAEHLARQTLINHSTPAHVILNANLVFKTIKQSGDLSKIKSQVVTDASSPHITDTNTQTAKAAAMVRASGAKLNVTGDTDHTESKTVFSYKTAAKKRGDSLARITDWHDFATEGDVSQARKTNRAQHRSSSTNDVAQNEEFGDNTSKERRVGRPGSRRTGGNTDRDTDATLADLT